MSDQKETALELKRLLDKRDANKNVLRDLIEEKKIITNKVRRVKERINNINQEIQRDKVVIQHFLELLERRSIEDNIHSKLLNKVISHPYVIKLGTINESENETITSVRKNSEN